MVGLLPCAASGQEAGSSPCVAQLRRTVSVAGSSKLSVAWLNACLVQVDDLIATGGTLKAGINLMSECMA